MYTYYCQSYDLNILKQIQTFDMYRTETRNVSMKTKTKLKQIKNPKPVYNRVCAACSCKDGNRKSDFRNENLTTLKTLETVCSPKI